MSAKVAVVVPVYRELNELEKISLAQCRKVLSRYPLIFVVPEGKNFSFVAAGDMIAQFPAENFRSVDTYSRLMLSPNFYETFTDFDYILIYQSDAFVFYDALEDFCSLGYDYIGAPWPRCTWSDSRIPKTPQVGNGGFSLRKVKACCKLLTEAFKFPNMRPLLDSSVEDAFFALCGVMNDFDFRVAPVAVAELFSMEWLPARQVKKINGLPFGCHGWTIFGADFYVELFAQFGWDLRPLRKLMSDDNSAKYLTNSLKTLALERLIRLIERGRSMLRYLPTKRFASVQVVRSPDTMKILTLLLTEENSLSDKIFIRDAQVDLLRDLTAENLPHLIISADYDEPLIEALERGGLRYGRDFVSFQREYMTRCEELFDKLGR